MTKLAQIQPVVETTQGRYQGLQRGAACAFLGMRYGTAERFKAPKPAPNFAGTKEANSFGPAAPQQVSANQMDPFLSWYAGLTEMSENCQFLNVFTPASDSAQRPVMVWLHGGGWMNFSSSVTGTDGTAFAAAQDVVVISLNHRLGALGFLALGDASSAFPDAGNAGLLDIVLVLKWVRDNVAAFGGDPDNVTIFGQSGGGAKVSALLGMSAAKGLFHKAIIQSMSGGLQIATPEAAAQITRNFIKAAGLDPDQTDALASLPLSSLISAQSALPRVFRPVIDNRYFDADPFLPSAPQTAKGIPLMAGCTATETTYYLRANPGSFAIDADRLQKRIETFLGTDATTTAGIIAAYRNTMNGVSPADILVAITTDQIFMRNTYTAARLHAEAGNPAFAFVFARETDVEGGNLRAPHCTDLPFIFGTTKVAKGHVGTGPDIAPMTRQMMTTWAEFARKGSPANDIVGDWPDYGAVERPVMALRPDPALLQDPGGVARRSLDVVPRYDYARSRGSFTSD